jgi:tetratricopeptide (TPR) repeat protein
VESVRTEELLHDMEHVSAELGSIQKLCADIMRVTRKLKKKIDKGELHDEEFAKLTVVAEKQTEMMDRHGRVLHLIGEHNFALELYMVQHAIATIDDIDEVDEKVTRQVDRAMVFYPSVSKAARLLKLPLDRLLHKLHRTSELEADQPDDHAPAEDWYQRALAFHKIESGRPAMKAVQHALRRDPDHVPALKLLASLYLQSNRLDAAIATVDRLRNLTRSARKLDDLAQEAQIKHRAWTERCARLNIDFSNKGREETELDAGWFYYRTKDYAKAIAKLERAMSENPTAEGYARLGQARLKHGDGDGAVMAWETGMKVDPDRPDFYKNLGLLALEHGMSQQAEEFLSAAFRLEIDDADVCERLARLCMARGAYAKAGLYYENLLRIAPNRTDLIPQIAALYHRQIATATQTQ